MESPTQFFPCPCCGYRVFEQMPGSHAVCPICRWEDDMSQLRFAQMPGGANSESLLVAQQNYVSFGAATKRQRAEALKADASYPRDPDWRLVNPERDNIEFPQRGTAYANSYPEADTTVLYYWRPSYWRRLAS